MKRIFLFFLFPLRLWAQDFTGTWTGWVELGGVDIPYELVIFEGESGLEGYAMTTVTMNDVKNIGIKTVKFDIKKNKLQMEDDELVFSDFSKSPKRNIMAAQLSIEGSGPTPELTGQYRTRSGDMRDRTSYTGKIFLKKVKAGENNELTARLNDLKLFPLKERFVYTEELIAKNEAALSEKKKNEGREQESAPEKEMKKTKQTRKKADETASVTKPEGKKETETNSQNIAAQSSKPKTNQQKTESSGNDNEEKSKKEKPDIVSKSAGNNNQPGDVRTEINLYNPAPAANLSSRKIEVIHNYFFSGDSLEITFYDNGTVDGDTISVLLNRNLIISKRQLTTEPLTETIKIPNNTDTLELIMYAENLGAYPPNTGIVIIKDGKSRVDIRFAGDLSRSASIMLRRKK